MTSIQLGKCSEFGGPNDETMAGDSGLAFYEPAEADRRPDIFHPEDPAWLGKNTEWADKFPNQRQPTWSRLKTEFFYLAMRFDHPTARIVLQNTPFKIRNLKTGHWCCAFPVDRGPGIETRLIDLSPGVMDFLKLETDDNVEVSEFS